MSPWWIISNQLYSQVPRDVSDAIYGRVQGAEYDVKNQYWTIPCGQYLNISFNFGGLNYPIHPLDTVDNSFQITNPSGIPACLGAVSNDPRKHDQETDDYSVSANYNRF